jgi:hypothetical protein
MVTVVIAVIVMMIVSTADIDANSDGDMVEQPASVLAALLAVIERLHVVPDQ